MQNAPGGATRCRTMTAGLPGGSVENIVSLSRVAAYSAHGAASSSNVARALSTEAPDIGHDIRDLAAREIHVRHFGMRIAEEGPSAFRR